MDGIFVDTTSYCQILEEEGQDDECGKDAEHDQGDSCDVNSGSDSAAATDAGGTMRTDDRQAGVLDEDTSGAL